jgi:UDP-4-amino-4,6-dideoxy-N-acetyl-beta-L-altrosamine transaminase
MIPYGRQSISQEDIHAVIEVLKSDYLTQGPAVPRFENAVKEYCQVKHAVAVNSATSALHIACLALGLGKGDIVWTTPITFVASANCALYCGADVDFVDIDPLTYNLSVDQLALKLAEAKINGKLPKIVIPVHLAGQSCNMEAIHLLGNEYGFKIIEDASHAIGGKYKGQPVGNCNYSDIAIFSFHPVKIITTGEGGMALTNDADIAERLQLLRSHGITRDEDKMTHASEGAWYYQQINLGFNYRMTDMQAALGMSQMKRLDNFVAQRHEIVKQYDIAFEKQFVTTPWQHSDTYSAFHLYIIRLQLEKINKSHKEIFELLRAGNISVNLHYIPIYRQPYYEKFGYNINNYPESEKYYAQAISLPIYFGLSSEQQTTVTNTIARILS